MTKTHSKIGASGMYRWAACPGSVRLSEGIESASSEYAAEGTVAHAIAEECLLNRTWPDELIGKVRESAGFQFTVNEDMADAVATYVSAIGDALKSDPAAEAFIEQAFDLSVIHPGLFGTADAVVWLPGTKTLKPFDYKHGAGIPVDVKNNPQLRYYALGAVVSLNLPVEWVDMTIVQPRCPHPDGPVRSERIHITDLMDFRHDLIQYAKATEDPNAPLNPGDHCRFCPAAAVCPALVAKAQAVAALEFGADTPYDPDKLAEALRWAPVLKAWIKSVDAFAYAEAEHGRCPPGFKLAEKRPTRKWRDEGEAIRSLQAMGLGEPEIYVEPVVRSPAQIEATLKDKLGMKPKERTAALADLTVKESSGLTLVPDSDKRPAVRKDAASEFEAV